MNHVHRVSVGIFAAICTVGSVSATELQLQPQITGFISNERITHLVPGGANAAREMEVSIALYDGSGKQVPLPGIPFIIEAYDGAAPDPALRTGRTEVTSNGLGQARVRLPLSACHGTGIQEPLLVHRTSNHPEYWDVTFVPHAKVRVIAAGRIATAHFVHVCRESYRGARP